MRQFEFVGCGRHRSVWRHGNFVVKVPHCEEGVWDNWHERMLFTKRKTIDIVPVARCRLLGSILVMEYARFVGPKSDDSGFIPYDGLPKWADWIDCQQVGYNRKGEIVAYDYA